MATSNPIPPSSSESVGVKHIPTEELQPNPHNPRLLFDREPLAVLRESIVKVGILVPITVYRSAGDKKYTILDGQRRWICAQQIGLETVPANEVAEPTLAENIVTMFQIHKLRLDWELMPTALKLEILIEELEERGDKHLALLTGLDVAVVTRCKKLLWYPRKYQDYMLVTDPNQRIKADFFIELYPIVTDRTVIKFDWYKRDYLIDRILFKYLNKKSGIKAVTDFRKIKQYIMAAKKSGEEMILGMLLKEFLDSDDLDISHIEVRKASVKTKSNKLIRTVKKLSDDLMNLDPMDFYGEEELWKSLESLLKIVQRKLRDLYMCVTQRNKPT